MNTFQITDEKINMSGYLLAVDPSMLMSEADWTAFSEALETFTDGDKLIEHNVVCEVNKQKFFISPPYFEEGSYPVVNIQTEDEHGAVEILSGFFAIVPLALAIELLSKDGVDNLVSFTQASLLYVKTPVEPEILDAPGVLVEPFRISPEGEEPEQDEEVGVAYVIDDINLAEDENAPFPFDPENG